MRVSTEMDAARAACRRVKMGPWEALRCIQAAAAVNTETSVNGKVRAEPKGCTIGLW